jgi:hypothetical protein
MELIIRDKVPLWGKDVFEHVEIDHQQRGEESVMLFLTMTDESSNHDEK